MPPFSIYLQEKECGIQERKREKKVGKEFLLNFVDGFQYFRGIQFARNDGIQHVLLLLHL